MRYRLLDYLYTAFHRAKTDGTPVLAPLWYHFPKDARTFGNDAQFFFGPSILVSPVLEENATSVDAYYPDALFYDFHTLAPTTGAGSTVQLTNVNFTTIPVSIKGGAVLPLRAGGAMTTTALRKTDFELVVAPSAKGTAAGELYFDDGVSVTQTSTTTVSFAYSKGKLTAKGKFGHALGVNVSRVRFAGTKSAPKSVKVNGKTVGPDYVLKNGDCITHTLHRHEPPVTADPIAILHEDNDMIVLNKPSGVPVHPSGRYNYLSITEIMKSERGPGWLAYPCNRLDRLTSRIISKLI